MTALMKLIQILFTCVGSAKALSIPSSASMMTKASSSPLFHRASLLHTSQLELNNPFKKEDESRRLVSPRSTSFPLQLANTAGGDDGAEEAAPPPPAFLVGLLGMVIHLVGRLLTKLDMFPKAVSQIKHVTRFFLAIFMLGGAFMRTDQETVDNMLIPMVPSFLPAKLCVYASGLVEAACAVLLVLPQTVEQGAKLTALLLVAVLPANINHAYNKEVVKKTKMESMESFLKGPRLIFQGIFIWWATWYL